MRGHKKGRADESARPFLDPCLQEKDEQNDEKDYNQCSGTDIHARPPFAIPPLARATTVCFVLMLLGTYPGPLSGKP